MLQEEPLNNGAWSYVGPRIYTAASKTEHHKGKYPYYAGRGPTSSVATGSKVICARRSDLYFCSSYSQGTTQEANRSIPPRCFQS